MQEIFCGGKNMIILFSEKSDEEADEDDHHTLEVLVCHQKGTCSC